MKYIKKSGNATLIFNTDTVTAEEKAAALREIAELKTRNELNALLKKAETGTA
ncbi:MAG: hypothetical protein Q4D26_10570 [Clostridia bacterium]|nr:hypothetical protein [Clostridia bacterium]